MVAIFKSLAVFASSLTLVSCNQADTQCAVGSPLILQGNGSLQVQSQWDACIAQNANLISKSGLSNAALQARLVKLCEPFGDYYVDAMMLETPKLSAKQAEQTKLAYSASIEKIAATEIARLSDCFE